jgi:hypothetical protein
MSTSPVFQQTVPILRIFDEAKAWEFDLDFWGVLIDPFGNRLRLSEDLGQE